MVAVVITANADEPTMPGSYPLAAVKRAVWGRGPDA